MEPLVSIIMPAYKAEASLAESIACIQAQHYTNWELLLFVDASPDQTLAIARKYAEADTRIRLLEGKKNRGVVRARNLCLRLAKGSWVAFCDADDFWSAQKLTLQWSLLQKQAANFCYTSATYYRADIHWESAPARMPHRLNLKRLLQGNPIGMSTVLLERKLLENLFFDALPPGIVHEDYAFWVKLFSKAAVKAVYLPLPTTKVSIHPNTRSGNKWRALKSQFYILRSYGGLSTVQAGFHLITYLLWALYKRGLATWLQQWRNT